MDRVGLRFGLPRGLIALAFGVAVPSWAAPPGVEDAVSPRDERRPVVSLRAGTSVTSGAAAPELCLEIAPWSVFALEACGAGAAPVGTPSAPDVAHFRGKIHAGAVTTPLGRLAFGALVGFAELEVGPDDAGFVFGSARGGTETAGPEVGVGLSLAADTAAVPVVMELQLNVAWYPFAGALVAPQAEVQPSVSLTVGTGF